MVFELRREGAVVMLALHIVAGALGLATGYVALYAPKGRALHRKSGTVFVYVMLAMALLGTTIAAVRNVAPALNIPAGLLTAYLVVTSRITVRRPAAWSPWLDRAAMVVALAVSLTSFGVGFAALAGPHQFFAVPSLMFGAIGLVAAIGDARMIRAGELRGRMRIARHLWRMCFALFIAALSFFLGQAHVIPAAVRIPAVLAAPILAVLVTMLHGLWRVRSHRPKPHGAMHTE